MRTLESFRANDMHAHCFAPYSGQYYKVVLLSHELAANALDLTWNDLVYLEYSTEVLNKGRNTSSAVITWYISVSHFVNELLELACFQIGQSYSVYCSSTLKDRLETSVRLFKLDAQGIPKTDLFDKVDEFDALYKALTLQTSNQLPPMQHTCFSDNAKSLNLTDSIQAMLIAYEVFELFRACVGGWDIMPLSDLMINGVRQSEHLDVLILKILLPSAIDILSKFQLGTNLNLTPAFPSCVQSPLFPPGVVALAQKIQQDTQFIIGNKSGTTKIVDGHFEQYCKKYQDKT